MPLDPGTTLGPYSVTAKIGEGGMGEVYRARDTKLDRDVALKVLPQAFTSDPGRLARRLVGTGASASSIRAETWRHDVACAHRDRDPKLVGGRMPARS